MCRRSDSFRGDVRLAGNDSRGDRGGDGKLPRNEYRDGSSSLACLLAATPACLDSESLEVWVPSSGMTDDVDWRPFTWREK